MSIKPLGDTRRPRSYAPRSDPGRYSYPNATVKSLVLRAYDVNSYQVDGPSWIDNQSYDIEAKIPEGALPSQVPEMLQSLLAERFGMKFHWESQIQPVYVLLVGKGGPKLRRSDEAVPLNDPNGRPISNSLVFSTSGSFQFSRNTMAQFARAMSGFLGRPVLDMTDLPGRFDIALDANPGDLEGLHRMFPEAGASEGGSASSSIFAALQELGLRLESRKAPIEHIVIDHVEKVPTEN